MYIRILLFIAAAYLCGSTPFSHLITRWRTGLAIYEVGEGNVGSRNVWHVAGPVWGVLAFVLDTLKGLGVFLGGVALSLPLAAIGLGGIAVMVGHQFSLFLHGQGGKGLATIGGFMLGLSPLSTICALALMGLAYLFFHDFNPSIIVAALGIIFLPLLSGQPLEVSLYALALGLLAGLKKLLDRPHEAHVWASHPWESQAKPGFHQAEGHNLQAEGSDKPLPPETRSQ
jgi:acyl phosphate:glycerol-3-phosphate acyltransferase